MINFAMVGYYVSDCGCKNNEFVKLKKGGYKTPAQLGKEGYKVVQFHGIISDQEVRHTGYVFIRGKEVTIAYRGTCNSYDFKRDVEIPLIRQYELLPKGGKIHLGFYSVFENSWESLYGILKGYANDQGLEIRDLKINLTGHSMGGAVANIAALCLSVTEDAKDLHIATFGAPRVFNRNAAKVCNELFGRKTIRVVNRSDSIPSLPPNFMGYKHVGKQLKIGRHSVPALHDHKLEVYHDLILKIKPKNFKSDNNTSATCYILSRTAREVYDVLTVPSCLIPSTHSSSDKQYFERVKDQHKNASFSEIINRYSELSNRNDKFLDEDRRNGIMGDIRASIKKPRGNYNKEGVMSKFKEQSEKSVSLGGGLPNIDNLTNSKGGSTINLREQNKRDETSLVESFENWSNSGEIFDIGSPNNLEEGEKTVVERVEYFNKYLSNPQPSKHTRLGVPTMGVNQVHLKQSKKKSVSLAEGLPDVNILTNSGIETPDADKSTNSKEERQSKKGSVRKRLSNLFRPKKKTQSNERSTSLRELFTLRETINEAEAEINGLQGEEKNQQESKLKETKELFPFSGIQTNQGKAIEEILCNVLESVDLETVKLIVGQKEIYMTASAEFALREALSKAKTKVASLEGEEKSKQGGKLREIVKLLSEWLYVIQNDHAPSVNGLDRAELEKAESEKIVAASTELEKVESEAKFEKLASVQDLYLDHVQSVNNNISEEDVNSTTSDQIIPFGSDELDSSSKDVNDTTGTLANQSTEYITLQTSDTPDSSSDEEDNHQLESEDNPQPEALANDTNTLDDNASLSSSDEHSSTSSNAGDVSTTEDITDNEEPVVTTTDSKEGNDQPTGKGDSQGPQIKSSKLPVIAASALALAGVASGAAIVVCLEMLAVEIAVGACCLVAAAVIYCCTPKSSVESKNVTKLTGDEFAAQQTVN
ncbi:lipase family protein [Wolbachia endosymbiont (group A) of Andrena hattorfiana]|nr:hypothetical protein [Wolbachia endosymbiont (group A) of Andrena hattorfiana]